MSSLALWLCTVLLLGSVMAADVPCGYSETGFHEIAAPDITPEQNGTVTLSVFSISGLAIDRSSPIIRSRN